MHGDWLTIGVLVLVGLTLGVTMLVAFLLWRDGYKRGWHAARTHPPACPHCGYQLSGLAHCRCPECGSSYTIDQLWSHAFIETGSRSSANRSADRATGELGRVLNDSQRPLTEH